MSYYFNRKLWTWILSLSVIFILQRVRVTPGSTLAKLGKMLRVTAEAPTLTWPASALLGNRASWVMLPVDGFQSGSVCSSTTGSGLTSGAVISETGRWDHRVSEPATVLLWWQEILEDGRMLTVPHCTLLSALEVSLGSQSDHSIAWRGPENSLCDFTFASFYRCGQDE